MKIRLAQSTGQLIGALRVSEHVFKRVQEMAKANGVSNQEVIRAILDEVIDEVEV